MNGAEIERLLSLLEDNDQFSPEVIEDILHYVEEHRQELLQQLERTGEISIPTTPNGEPIVLRKAA